MVDLEKLRYSPLEIAKLEFEKGFISITVKRPYPSTRKEKTEKDKNNKKI